MRATRGPRSQVDTWGKHALRNALASGPLNAPVNTWLLAAHSAADLAQWLIALREATASDAAGPSTAQATRTRGGLYGPIGAEDAPSLIAN